MMPNGFVSIYAVEAFNLKFLTEPPQRDGSGGNEALDHAMIVHGISNAM
tara:strand:- start:148 stop:294 length:147 start_codon:yes stop_codon:yes gene_type:complete